MGIVQL